MLLMVLLAVIFGGFIAYIAYNFNRRRLPKGYSYVPPSQATVAGKREDITRDGFSVKKIPPKLDAIVIGSGMGSLTCAGLLAKCGKRVLVLEQHYVTGGCTHAYEEGGYEFDTGLHYVGNAKKYGKLIDAISGERKVRWEKMGAKDEHSNCYDEIVLGDDAPFYFNQKGHDSFAAALIEEFPDEEQGIRGFVSDLKSADKSGDAFFIFKLLPRWVGKLLAPWFLKSYTKWASVSALEVVNARVKNPRLRALLLSQFGDYGGPPSKGSFWIAAGVINHYLKDGGYYPVGGPQEISRAIIPCIERSGGRVLVRAPVKSIVVKNGKAVGVEMAKNGIQIMAPIVISGAGAFVTYEKLLSKEITAPMSMYQQVTSLGHSRSHLYCFVGLKGTAREHGFTSSNLWYLPCDKDYDLERMCERYYKDPLESPMMCFISFPSAKDPTWETRFPGKSTCVIVAEAEWSWFEKWRDARQGHRGDDYEDKKKLICEKMMSALYHFYPNCRDSVDYVDFSTPVSARYYLGSEQGESYGLSMTPKRFNADFLRPDTPIPRLYLTGQDVCSAGVFGALGGGVITAHAVMGYPSLMDILTKRDFIRDVMNVPEDDA